MTQVLKHDPFPEDWPEDWPRDAELRATLVKSNEELRHLADSIPEHWRHGLKLREILNESDREYLKQQSSSRDEWKVLDGMMRLASKTQSELSSIGSKRRLAVDPNAKKSVRKPKKGGPKPLRTGIWKRIRLSERMAILRRYEELEQRFYKYEAAAKVNEENDFIFGEDLDRRQLEKLYDKFDKNLAILNETGTLP